MSEAQHGTRDTEYGIAMKPSTDVGIVGYGAYVPRYRLPATEVARPSFIFPTTNCIISPKIPISCGRSG